MWELDNKKYWALKNWCLWTVALEKTLESPLDCKEIQPVHPKGNQSWIFILEGLMLMLKLRILWATWCEELTHWKRLWCWERLRAGEGDDRGWDGWMISSTQWTWVGQTPANRRHRSPVCSSKGTQAEADWATEHHDVRIGLPPCGHNRELHHLQNSGEQDPILKLCSKYPLS